MIAGSAARAGRRSWPRWSEELRILQISRTEALRCHFSYFSFKTKISGRERMIKVKIRGSGAGQDGVSTLQPCLFPKRVPHLSSRCRVWLLATPWAIQHTRLLCPPLSARVYLDSSPLSQWYYLTISSSATPLSSCLQSSRASVSFLSWLFPSGGHSLRESWTKTTE